MSSTYSFFGREWILTIEDKKSDKVFVRINGSREQNARKEYGELKMTFNVTIDSGGYITYMDLSLFNLSNETMNELSRIETEYSSPRIVLSAGYKGDFNGLVFDGFVKNHIKTRRGADIVYRILATTSRPRNINTTLGKNATINNMITILAKEMDSTPDFDPKQFEKEAIYSRGYNLQGDPELILRKLAKTHNFQWVKDRGRLFVHRADVPSPKGAVEINVQTGMEGVPEITETGCVVTTRMNFDVVIGGKFNVKSTFAEVNYTGQYFNKFSKDIFSKTYNVLKLEYTGDTHGDAWSTRITGTVSDTSQ